MSVLTRHLISTIAALLLLPVAACSDGDFIDRPVTPMGSLTLCLGAGEGISRSDQSGQHDDLSPATASERNITDLRYFIFPKSGGQLSKGTLAPLPTPDEMADERYKEYTIKDVNPGTYRIYVVANMPECATAETEEELKKIMLSYDADNLPLAGNLPMVYEPFADTEITPGGTTVTAALQFTCVKVRYNIIFDKANNAAAAGAFGTSGVMITSVNGHRLSSSAPLVLGGPMTEALEAGTFDAALPTGTYHADWTRNNSPANGDDVITVTADAPARYSDRWIYRGTLYLPERYIKDNSHGSLLSIKTLTVDADYATGTDRGTIPAGPVNEYTIALGHSDSEGHPRQFPRGTYYEIIAEIESTRYTELEAQVTVGDWIPVAMADMGHTTLTVNKTKAKVTSIDNDSIVYTSNRNEVRMGCDLVIDGKPVIVLANHNPEKRTINFGINPEIPIGSFKEGSEFPPVGTTTIWLQAGNIRKYLEVSYDVQPLFEIIPDKATINWLHDKDTDETYTKTFSYRTNLGGIDGISFPCEITSGNSTIRIECADPTAATGAFTVTALNNPGTTTDHTFTLSPRDGSHSELAKEITVTVKPPAGDYRVYFRAINNRENSDTWAGILDENIGNFNYLDGWDSHNIYCYTQIGETVNGKIPEYFVWEFTKSFPGDEMTGDTSNKGWYYYDFPVGMKGRNKKNDGSTRPITPGETLLMFCESATTGSVSRHRCSHHMDPGISLFDYEDNEGWILYDPLCDPYYKVFDSRPDIHDVSYIIYTESPVIQWYTHYGVADITDNSKFTLKQDNPGSILVATKYGDMYCTTLKFKAPEGDYAKTIYLKLGNGQYCQIFGGRNYYRRSQPGKAAGYYRNGVWEQATDYDAIVVPDVMKRIYLHIPGHSDVRLYAYSTTPGVESPSGWDDRPRMSALTTGWWYIDIDKRLDRLIFTWNGGRYPAANADGIESNDIDSSQYYSLNNNGTICRTDNRP